MLFPKEFVEKVKDSTVISEVVRRKVVLKSKGASEHSGLCPFHAEKSPSFTVSDDKGFFHCFGCGAHGDVIGFVMRNEGLSFPETVERLAREAGLPIPVSSPEERERTQRQATL